MIDIGAGFTNIVAYTSKDNCIEIKAILGDERICGRLLDTLLVDYCADLWLKEKGLNVRKNKKAMRRLMTECEKVKVDLSVNNKVPIFIDYLLDGEDFECSISRQQFEDLIKNDLLILVKLLEKVLSTFNCFQKRYVNEVVLSGGCSRTPLLKEILLAFFDKQTVVKSIFNPDEAVGVGVTLQTALMVNANKIDWKIVDVTP